MSTPATSDLLLGLKSLKTEEEALRVDQQTLEAKRKRLRDLQGASGEQIGAFYSDKQQNKIVDMQTRATQLTQERNFYAGQGNKSRTVELDVERARVQKELNIEMNQGTLFADSLRVKLLKRIKNWQILVKH